MLYELLLFLLLICTPSLVSFVEAAAPTIFTCPSLKINDFLEIAI